MTVRGRVSTDERVRKRTKENGSEKQPNDGVQAADACERKMYKLAYNTCERDILVCMLA